MNLDDMLAKRPANPENVKRYREQYEAACNCAPDASGVIVHNSWAHPEQEADQ